MIRTQRLRRFPKLVLSFTLSCWTVCASAVCGVSAIAEAATFQNLHSPADLLYVGNDGNDTITVYHHRADGNQAPLFVIGGPLTELHHPGQLDEDAAGNLYVANGSGGVADVLVFAHGAAGDVAPVRRLNVLPGIPNTITGMTVDKMTGKIFVLTQTGEPFSPYTQSILRYESNAAGNAAPRAQAFTAFPSTGEVAMDSTGMHIIVPHGTNAPSETGFGLETMDKYFVNGLHYVQQIYGVGGFLVSGIADDPVTQSYVTSSYGSQPGIYRLMESTQGSGPDNPYGNGHAMVSPTVQSVITSASTCDQLAVGYLQKIYAVCGMNAVEVFYPNAHGNAIPLRTLTGPATKLNLPYGIYVGH